MGRNLFKPAKTVDLHAESFIANIEAYDTNELLGESIDILRENLDAAIYWGYPEIKFIHGRGTGKLKQAVYEELKIYKDQGAIRQYYSSYQNEDIVVVIIGI
ncbi:Smr/MutS family protein [Sphingobacterium sp. HJSM2_6]|uniref:Smr/MutS family protein n=1 Tax=Sphingobacterium sp. HJSM2_6 TaxID=3366264 RepID=UPI003BD12688